MTAQLNCPAAYTLASALHTSVSFVPLERAEELELYPALERLGLSAYPTAANFLAVTVPGSATDAYESLLAHGVVTRNGDTLGMQGRLRITIGTAEQNAQLLAALASLAPAHA